MRVAGEAAGAREIEVRVRTEMGLGFCPSYMILFWPAKILASTTEIS
jgi:hypothetical protein